MSTRPITSCNRYSVKYRDLKNKTHEIGVYAIDAYEAHQLAIEFNDLLQCPPGKVERIKLHQHASVK